MDSPPARPAAPAPEPDGVPDPDADDPNGADGDGRPPLVLSRPSAPADAAPDGDVLDGDALRLCVVDIGSNSFHAVVVDAFPDGTFAIRDRLKEIVKLGERGFNEHRLTDEAMGRGIAALRQIRALGDGWGASAYLACATSAVREASNGGAFLARARRETGLDIQLITGETEARLTYLAVRHAVDLTEPSLLVDIGGGSTEFTVADADGPHLLCSLPLGAQRLTERFITTDPVGRDEFRALRDHVRASLGRVFAAARARGVRRVVGSSGTLESLAGVAAASYGDAEARVFEQTFDAGQMREVTKRVMRSARDERLATPGIGERRADQIVAGAILLDVVLKDLGVERFVVSPEALREGIVLDYLARERKWIRRLAPFRSRRREAVYALAMRLRFDRAHAEHVARLALRLFDATRPLHGRGDDARELLEFAALLHDVGYAISRRNHHLHALYVIREAELPGFAPAEQAVLANVARYHRSGLPRPTHVAFQRLAPEQRRLVLELAALLRLANGLDRSHLRAVARLDAELTDTALRLTIRPATDPALDVWAARLGSDLFEAVLGRTVEIAVREGAWEGEKGGYGERERGGVGEGESGGGEQMGT